MMRSSGFDGQVPTLSLSLIGGWLLLDEKFSSFRPNDPSTEHACFAQRYETYRDMSGLAWPPNGLPAAPCTPGPSRGRVQLRTDPLVGI